MSFFWIWRPANLKILCLFLKKRVHSDSLCTSSLQMVVYLLGAFICIYISDWSKSELSNQTESSYSSHPIIKAIVLKFYETTLNSFCMYNFISYSQSMTCDVQLQLVAVWCRAGVSGGALASPVFGSSANPIRTIGGRLCPPHYC